MNTQAIRILFLKDLFLSRKPLFAYLAGGLICACIACVPRETFAFMGFIMVITVAIAAGIHLIGTLLLGDSMDQTRLFVMSLPVSLLDYSIAKISVVLTAYLIPWLAMLTLFGVVTFMVPGGKHGAFAVVPAIFGFMLAGFTLQLVTAVVTESLGWTIGMVVAGNVLLNLFLKKLFENPTIQEVTKSELLSWPTVIQQIMVGELLVAVLAVVIALAFQSRKRDLV